MAVLPDFAGAFAARVVLDGPLDLSHGQGSSPSGTQISCTLGIKKSYQ